MFNRKKLSDYMSENNITNSMLAKQFGVSEGTIRHIVTGLRQPSLAMTCDIADMMGCKIDDLTC